MTNDITTNVIEMVRTLAPSNTNVTEDSRLTEDLGLDSLDAVELIMELETMFDMDIIDNDAAQWRTVGDAVDTIKEIFNNKTL